MRFAFGSDLNSFDLPIARDMRIGGIRVGPQQLQQSRHCARSGRDRARGVLLADPLGQGDAGGRRQRRSRAAQGHRSRRLANLATFIGMGLAGIGGALLAIDTSVDPSTGSRLILLIFAAASSAA